MFSLQMSEIVLFTESANASKKIQRGKESDLLIAINLLHTLQ